MTLIVPCAVLVLALGFDLISALRTRQAKLRRLERIVSRDKQPRFFWAIICGMSVIIALSAAGLVWGIIDFDEFP